jgi:hypothetical protein
MSDTDDSPAPVGLDPIVREAHKRFERCQKWEAVARTRWMEDYQFANGDSDNCYQWPDKLYVARLQQDRPSLTINKLRQHNLQIINDAKQKKSGIKYRPVGEGATVEAAEVLEGIVRHIQDVSNADAHRGAAITFQVDAGSCFTRIVTDYESDRTFDQEIFIRGVPDPMSCYLDPDCVEPDGSDARYGFVFADRPRDEVEREHPEIKHKLGATNAVDGQDANWSRDKTVREAEYYRLKEEEDELIGARDGTTGLRSVLGSALVKQWEAEAEATGETLQRRKVIRKNLEWFKIIGSEIVERREPPGRSIPIIPWIGEQTIINNQLDRKGHTRALKDAQRMLNYNRSASVEFGALQSKAPWLAPTRSIEGYETYWETANTENHSILPYNDVADDGTPIAAPQRQNPPQSAPAFLEGSQAAERDMMVASGQYEAEMGAPSNEVSGRAINERQRQGDRATYHFIDQQAIALRREGQIILELIPEVYDTERVKRILGEDGTEDQVTISPMHGEALARTVEGVLFNPNVGRYAVVADVGPDYATQRQEAFNAIVQILTQAPALIDRIGDLLFKVADFPLADEIAERMKPGLPPQAQQAIGALQQQLAEKNQTLGEVMQALTEERLKVKAKDSDSAIDAFDADTKRLAVIKDMLPLDPASMQAMIHETVRQALQDNLGPVIGSLAASLRQDVSQGAAGQMPVRLPDVNAQMSAVGVPHVAPTAPPGTP